MLTAYTTAAVPELSSTLEAPGAGRMPSRDCALEVCERGAPQRAALERFVQESFKRAHGADVCSFMPTLLALRDASGKLRAVTGYRAAFDRLLYLEDYLDTPVEIALAQKTGRAVRRRAIAEVGNFAARDRRSAQQLMRRLPLYLLEHGYPWIVFTATRAVRRLLDGFGAHPVELCPARAECIAGGAKHWGHYYDTDPRVMAGYLPAGLVLAAFKPEVGY